MTDQADGQIIEDRQGFCGRLGFHPTPIFIKRHISPIMRSVFDPPMRPIDFKQCFRARLFNCVRSDSVDCLAANLSCLADDRLAFDLEDLPQVGPIEI